MKRTKPIVLIMPATAVFVALALYLTKAPEPAFKGRSAAAWVARLGRPQLLEKARALEAIQIMGTNALPAVLKHLGRPDARLTLWCNHLAERFPTFHVHFATQPDWRWAMQALVLDSGPESRHAAVAALAQLSHDGNAGVRAAALEALSVSQAIYTEPEALRAMEIAQSDPDIVVRTAAQRRMQAYNMVHGVRPRVAPNAATADGDISFSFEAGSILPAAGEP